MSAPALESPAAPRGGRARRRGPLRHLAAIVGVARTSYLELVRQPVFGVVLAAGLALVALSPALAVFSLGRAEALVLDLGASALLFFSVFVAATAVAAGSAERLADGTTLLVLTHPIGPAAYLAGSFLGAMAALAQSALLMGIVLAWGVRCGPESLHWGVAYGALGALAASLGWGLRASLGGRAFQPAAIAAATLTFPVAMLASLAVARDGALTFGAGPAAPSAAVEAMVPGAVFLAWLAAVLFAAFGLAVATRAAPGAAATMTLVAFLLSSLVRGPLGPEALGVAAWATVLLPDLQLFWVGDAAYTETPLPPGYLAGVAAYSALYVVSAIAAGAFLLGGRELGRGAAD